MAAPAVTLVERARRFFLHDLWNMELEGGSLATAPFRFLQFAAMVVEGFVREELLLRASALTYVASLALIPAIVVVLAVLKGLGVTEQLVAALIDYLAIPGAKEPILHYVRSVDLSAFGSLGALLLLISTVLALRHAEQALNAIWGVVHGRTWLRRFTDYLAVLIIAPLSLAVSLSLRTTMQSDPIMEWLLRFEFFDLIFTTGLRYAPALLLVGAFTFVYWFLPNTEVRLRSALIGGVTAAVLFVGAQNVYVGFNIGAARYSAFFGTAAVLPLFFVWMYVSAAIFLLGGLISYAHQNLESYRRELQGQAPSAAEREALALCVALEAARAFRACRPPRSAEELAGALGVSIRAVRELLQELVAARIVAPVGSSERDEAYLLGRPADDISVADVLAAVRGLPGSGGVEAAGGACASDPSRDRPPRASGGVCDAEGARDPELASTARVVRSVLRELDAVLEPIARGHTLAELLSERERTA